MNAMSNISVRPRVALRQMSIVGYANGFSQHHYRADRISDVFVPGFFDDALTMKEDSMLPKEGDHISVSAPDGGAVLYVGPNRKVIVMCSCEVVE